MGWMGDGVALGRVALLYGTADPYLGRLRRHPTVGCLAPNGAPLD